MNIVEVKHDVEHKKSYWFEVPDELVNVIQEGTYLICNTACGKQAGIAQSNVLSGDGIERMATMCGATLPLRKVVGVEYNILIEKVKIRYGMTKSLPGKSKLVKRINEYYERGCFNTAVVLDKQGFLKDGYTAYLVAKMFGLADIPVRLMVTDTMSA